MKSFLVFSIIVFLFILINSCSPQFLLTNTDVLIATNPQNAISLLYANDSLDYHQGFSSGFKFIPIPKNILKKIKANDKVLYNIKNTIGHHVSFIAIDYNKTKGIKTYQNLLHQKIKIQQDTLTSIYINNNEKVDSTRSIFYTQKIGKIKYQFLEKYIPIQHNQIIRTISYCEFDSIKASDMSNHLTYQEQSSLLSGFNIYFMKRVKSSLSNPYDVSFLIDSAFGGNARLTCKYLDQLYSDTSKLTKSDKWAVATIKMWNSQFWGDYSTLAKILNKYENLKFNDSTIIENIELKNAVDFVQTISKRQDLFLLNDHHNEPISRWFAAQLLDVLYNNGYKYLAVETLDGRLKSEDLSVLNDNSGYYSKEATFSLFLQLAIKKGFKLVPYENTKECIEPINNNDKFYCPNQREQEMTNNILKVYLKDPDAKIFVYAGHDHIRKHTNDDWKFMAIDLVKSGKKVYSIDQIKLLQKPTTEKTNNIYNKLIGRDTIKNSMVLMENQKPYLPQQIRKDFDALVLHPFRHLDSYKDEDLTPWFYHQSEICSQRIEINITDEKLKNTLLEIFPEDKKEYAGQISPQFKRLVKKTEKMAIYLPKYAYYYIQFVSINGEVKGKYFYNVNTF